MPIEKLFYEKIKLKKNLSWNCRYHFNFNGCVSYLQL